MKRLPLSGLLFVLLSSAFFAFNTADAAAGGGRRGAGPVHQEAPAGLPGAMPGSIFAASDTILPTGNVVLNFKDETVQTVVLWLQHATYYTFLLSKDLPVGDISFSTRTDPTKPDGGLPRAEVIPKLEKLLADNGVTLVPMEGATILAVPSNSRFAKVDVFAGRARPTPPPPPAADAPPPESAPAGIPPDADLTKLPKPSDKVGLTFAKDIGPIFAASCVKCHTSTGRRPTSGLDLSTLAGALKGGSIGKDILPGDAADSFLVVIASSAIGNMPMPPGGPNLSPEQLGLIMAWINQGAEAPPESATPAAPVVAEVAVPAPPPITPAAPLELTLPGMVGRPSMFQNVQFPDQPINLAYNHATDVAVILKWLADNTGFTITAAPNLPPTHINYFSTDYGQADITAKLWPGLAPAEVALALERLLFIDGIGLVPDSSKTFGLLAVPLSPTGSAATK